MYDTTVVAFAESRLEGGYSHAMQCGLKGLDDLFDTDRP